MEWLAREAALTEGPCTFVAELLVERGDLDGALRWYDRAVARLDPENLEALWGPEGWMQVSSVMRRGRREVRRRLGLPADATDEIAPLAPLQRQPAGVDGLRDLSGVRSDTGTGADAGVSAGRQAVASPLEDRFSVRRGTYRIIYRIDDATRTVTVVDVDHRRDFYRS